MLEQPLGFSSGGEILECVSSPCVLSALSPFPITSLEYVGSHGVLLGIGWSPLGSVRGHVDGE